MKIFTLFSAAAFLALVPANSAFAATAMSEADCTTMMQKMDKNADGTMDATESKDMIAKMDEMKMTHTSPDMMTKEEFMKGCGEGAFEGMDKQ